METTAEKESKVTGSKVGSEEKIDNTSDGSQKEENKDSVEEGAAPSSSSDQDSAQDQAD